MIGTRLFIKAERGEDYSRPLTVDVGNQEWMKLLPSEIR